MAGVALDVPRFVLVGYEEDVGFASAVLGHYLTVVFNGLARGGGHGGDIGADPALGSAALGEGIGLHDRLAGIRGDCAGHGHAHLVGNGVGPVAIHEGSGGVLVGGIRQRDGGQLGVFAREHLVDGHRYLEGAARLVAVRHDYLLGLERRGCVDGVADDVGAIFAGIFANIVAGAGKRARAGKHEYESQGYAAEPFEMIVHCGDLLTSNCVRCRVRLYHFGEFLNSAFRE